MKRNLSIQLIGLASIAMTIFSGAANQVLAQDDIILDDLPGHVVATIEARNKWLAALPQGDTLAPQYFVDDILLWYPGQVIRVAFLGGDTELHKEIEEATKEISDVANIKLDFGYDADAKKYRSWSTSDTRYQAEIRVSFDQKGNFSIVGRDSINPKIGDADREVGGRPNQRSLNLGGVDRMKPATWIRTVRHEFLHALAFNHEHQSFKGGCDSQFRWEDDPGYQFTQNENGEFIQDPNGKRPGVYTYLSGYPNFWDRDKVNHNLRQASPDSGISGPFDRASIMLYRFPALFYVSSPNNPCAPVSSSQNLSDGDIAGLRRLYPYDINSIVSLQKRHANLFRTIETSNMIDASIKEVYSRDAAMERGGALAW